MLANGESRVRSVAYENAPQGRAVDLASPYRWWLGLLARGDHLVTGRPIGLSVERVALWADPLLQAILLIVGTCVVAWQFGGMAAALFSICVVSFFPFAGEFLPGMPDDRGLAQTLLVFSLLAIFNAVRPIAREGSEKNRRGRSLARVRGLFQWREYSEASQSG